MCLYAHTALSQVYLALIAHVEFRLLVYQLGLEAKVLRGRQSLCILRCLVKFNKSKTLGYGSPASNSVLKVSGDDLLGGSGIQTSWNENIFAMVRSVKRHYLFPLAEQNTLLIKFSFCWTHCGRASNLWWQIFRDKCSHAYSLQPHFPHLPTQSVPEKITDKGTGVYLFQCTSHI